MTAPVSPTSGAREEGHTAPYADRILFERLESDGRVELQLVRDGKVLAYCMVDAVLAQCLSNAAAAMAELCRDAARTPSPRDPATDGVARDERGRG